MDLNEIRTISDVPEEDQPENPGFALDVREIRAADGSSRWLGTVKDNIPDRPEVWGSSFQDALQRLENSLRGRRRILDGSVRRG